MTAGGSIVRASWAGTVLLVVLGAGALVLDALVVAYVAVSGLAFVVGALAFAVAMVTAAGRSREESIGMGGLFFLLESAPPGVRRSANAALAVQVVATTTVAAVGFAGIDDTSLNPLAFGVLAPLYGLGLSGLWGARHGTFPPRPVRAEG